MTTENEKKNKELIILNKLYNYKNIKNSKQFFEIIESERPDFIIKAQDETFGVEITEFYYNESTARLKNYPGYFNKIISSTSNKVLDKKDIGILSHNKLYIKNPITNKYNFVADTVEAKYHENYLSCQIPRYQDIEPIILEIIKNKNHKAKKYSNLDYFELFINDAENYFEKINLNNQNTEKLLYEVTKSRFRRIYIFSGKLLFVVGDNPKKNWLKYHVS